ncbi:MAG: hypothetical protein AAF525_10250 [Pseudomonadota bacterium]
MFTTYKRWTLREGRNETELVDLVSNRTIPHFEKLNSNVKLGLLRIEGTRSYLALQHWPNRELWESTMSSEAFQSWYDEYQPILQDWDSMMAFESEWESEELI